MPDNTGLVAHIEEHLRSRPAHLELLQSLHWPFPMPWTAPTTGHGHIWVTIGLPLGKTPLELYALVQGLTPRVAQLVGASAVMEFHPHPHVHILGHKPEKYHKGNLIKVISRALKLERTTLVDIKLSTRASDYKHRQDYLSGDKASTEKQELVSHDANTRKLHGIPDIISL